MDLIGKILRRIEGTKKGLVINDFIDSGLGDDMLVEYLDALVETGDIVQSPNGRYFPRAV